MSRSISGELPIPIEQMLEKLQFLAGKHDVKFVGDQVSGYAHGKGFHIEYLVEDKTCTLTVTQKPIFVPWKAVEKALAKLFPASVRETGTAP
jgi:hypothetical protein